MVSYYSMTSGIRVHVWGGTRGQNLVHVTNLIFLLYSFLAVHILITTYQKAFILGLYTPYRVIFHFMTSEPRICAEGVGLEVKI